MNAEQLQLTGNKDRDKLYARHSRHPGGINQVSAGDLNAK